MSVANLSSCNQGTVLINPGIGFGAVLSDMRT